MNEEMKFPKTFEEFIKQYSFFDKQQIYTNGSELIQVFRIKQWEEHKEKENIKYKNQQKEFINYLEDEIKKLSKKWGNKLTETGYLDIAMTVRAYRIILQKYKEIIGDDK